MQFLTAPNNQYQGCHTKFVDTAFIDMKDGKPVEIITTNKDGFLTSNKREKKLKLQTIQHMFSEIVRDRRRV